METLTKACWSSGVIWKVEKWSSSDMQESSDERIPIRSGGKVDSLGSTELLNMETKEPFNIGTKAPFN